MILYKKDFKILISALLLLFICRENSLGQGTSVSSGHQKGFFIGFSAGPSQTSIINTGSTEISDIKSTKKISFSGQFDIGYLFSNRFGLSSGIGISSYSSSHTLGSYTNAYDTTDSELEKYNRRVSGKDISETQKIMFINIPVLASLKFPVSRSFGFFLISGINLSVPMKSKYSNDGTFSYSGFYSAYNVLLTDIPHEGFSSEVKSYDNGSLKIKSFIPELVTGCGIEAKLNDMLGFSFGIFYNRMLSDLSGYSGTNTFNLSSNQNKNKSLMEGSSNVSAGSAGIKFSISILL